MKCDVSREARKANTDCSLTLLSHQHKGKYILTKIPHLTPSMLVSLCKYALRCSDKLWIIVDKKSQEKLNYDYFEGNHLKWFE